ncbi:unnamed protein product [Trichobilharzia regenti]|nr:unnamed protein product [Trichobilharzia regenti]
MQDSSIRFLESLGVNVSQKLIEKATKDHARFVNELDIVKYICTEFWSSVYHKQYLAFPSGLLKGALRSLGLNCVVTADCEQPPTCKCKFVSFGLSLFR